MILDLFKLDGRVAIVTGASRGIGQALALGLAQAGADIACITRSGNADATRELVEGCGRRFLDIAADLVIPKAEPDWPSGSLTNLDGWTSSSTTPALQAATSPRGLPRR